MPLLKSMVLGLVVVLAATAGAAAQTWSEYRSAAGRYRIEMPGTPKLETREVKAGQERQPSKQASVAASQAVYVVAYSDFSAEEVRIVAPQRLLEAMRDGTSEGSKLRSDRALTVAGYPAREYVIEDGDGVVFVSRSVLVHTRLYTMMVATDRPGATADRADIRRFIDSFALIPAVGYEQLRRWCSEGPGDDEIIEGCDAFLKSATEPKAMIPRAFLNRGIAYYSKTQYDRALQDFDHALKLKPDLAEAYFQRASVYSEQRQYDRALKDYDQFLRLRPNDPLALSNRANVYKQMGNYDRALEDLDQALKLSPDDIKALHNRSLLFMDTGRYDRALPSLDRLVELMPDYSFGFAYRGMCYFHLDQYDRARRDFDQAIKLNPEMAEAYVGRGDVWNNSGQPKRALLDYDKALSLRLDYAAAHAGRGDAYAALRQYRRAIDSYDQAIVLEPEQADLFVRRGDAYKAMGQAARAAKDYAEGNRLRAP